VVKTFSTHSEMETAAVGHEVALTVNPGTMLLLSGDLGAGKTAFIRGFAEGLGIARDEVSSPTFTLIQEYRGGRVPLLHVDLYRLNDPREIEDLGLEELGRPAVLAIEWGERLPDPPADAVWITISHGEGDERTIRIDSSAPPS
jgi:tRNA threonylcarbamoyladenosine biosynthesis protein TsaE